MALNKFHPETAGYEVLPPRLPSKQHHRRYYPKVSTTVITALLIVLGFQFVILPRYVYQLSLSEIGVSKFHLNRLDAGLQKCKGYQTLPTKYPATKAGSRTNPRWNPTTGQNETIVLKNATLFDGEMFLDGPVDILLKKGIIESVSPSGQVSILGLDAKVFDLNGKFITPGLIDMHSHHLTMTWPGFWATGDVNEVHPETGPLTPQVRIIDSIKAYDLATTIIASGGVTTSLILPGSTNIMGGEAVLVKNTLNSGDNSEPVVEEILLEHGVPKEQRRRYMKMACGENPRRVYKHTRMGNAWIFRKHMERAKELKGKQDAWCLSAAAVRERGESTAISTFMESSMKEESATDYLQYDSSIAMLRGQVGINVHCYESEDFEDMIKHSKEFGFRIQAFHHALDAWEVPELIKASGENITIATFAEFGFYKKEAYDANLWAGKILAEHGIPVAYKSDHVIAETNAKYLLFQAATAHSFHLPKDLALQSVTSVPARSLEIDHRVGFARSGYDADLVIWDSHPLSVGATALQVFIDGLAILDPKKVSESLSSVASSGIQKPEKPSARKVLDADAKENICSDIEKAGSKFIVKGIAKSYVDDSTTAAGTLSLVIENSTILCFDSEDECASHSYSGTIINLENGYVLPGLTAVTVSLGLAEIAMDESTSDGDYIGNNPYTLDPKTMVYAKYGVHLEGRAFSRARIGGVTKAITQPLAGGFAGGVSVGIKTSGKKTILDGGIFQDDVALHFTIGQHSKSELPTVSSAISRLRQILSDNSTSGTTYERAANGTFPVVVSAENEYDILQLIKIKQEYPAVRLVILGGSGAPLVAQELADAKVPVILTSNRGAPDTFEKRNSLPGPPLSRSPSAVLAEAGVKFGLAITGESDSHIHNIPIEAGWAAKYAGLSGKEAVDLVSRNIEEILGLDVKDETRDFVVYEGNPLEFGASVVFSFDREEGVVSTCWPESN